MDFQAIWGYMVSVGLIDRIKMIEIVRNIENQDRNKIKFHNYLIVLTFISLPKS